jgi:ABC-type branched-subunit amino acid transport system substrate-binding protein
MVGAMSLLAPTARASVGVVRVRADTLRVGVVLPDSAAAPDRALAVRRGVELGAEESARTSALFGLTVDVRYTDARAADSAAHRLLAKPVSALVVGLGEPRCRDVAQLARAARTVAISLVCASPDGGGRACDDWLFYVAPSSSTVDRARGALRAAAPASARVVLWHHTLQRFGAEQLNARFRRRFGADMDPAAWAGWVSLKILTEAALRSRAATPASLARYLTRPAARFDGHKGEPLSFNARTGELRQPLYLVDSAGGAARGRVVAELPVAASGSETDVVCGASPGENR